MLTTSAPRDPTERTPWPRPRRPRPSPPGKRRPGFRPGLETVAVRCLLSSYNIPDLTFPGGHLLTASAINSLGQVAGRGTGSGVNNAVVWQNGAIINLDPQQLHGVSAAIELTNPVN